ncbi:MAG: hypothetical protein R2911_34315 [Caldilineaceae bacterium]
MVGLAILACVAGVGALAVVGASVVLPGLLVALAQRCGQRRSGADGLCRRPHVWSYEAAGWSSLA